MKVRYIDGLRGFCCIQVFIGHAVGILLPAMYWGVKYQSHVPLEADLSTIPIAMLWNAPSAMICFLVLSGYVSPLKSFSNSENTSVIDKWGSRYCRLMPMALIGIVLGWLVMKLDLVYSFKIVDITYSYGYGDVYNNFALSSLLSKGGPIIEGLFGLFTNGSKYNAPMTTVKYIFIFGFVFIAFAKYVAKFKYREIVYVCSIIIGIIAGQFIKYECFYFGAMALGFFLSDRNNNHNTRFKHISVSEKIVTRKNGEIYFNVAELLLSVLLLSSSYTSLGQTLNALLGRINYAVFYMLGWTLLVDATRKIDILRRILESNVFQFIGKHSFAFYAIHWPFVISGTCIVTLVLYKNTSMNYMTGAFIAIGISIPIIIGLSYVVDRWIYLPIKKAADWAWDKLIAK